MKRILLAFGTLISALCVTGCMVGPRYQRPATDAPQAYRGAMAPDTNPNTASLGDEKWAEVFQAFEAEPDRDWAGEYRKSPYFALYSNSLRHSRSGPPGETVTVTVTARAGAVRVEVADRSGPGVPELRPAGADAEGGRGLALVAGLAARWGWRRRGGRTVTWVNALWDSGTPPTIAAAAGGRTLVRFRYNGDGWVGFVFAKGY